jgi:hypothetical protein
MKKQKTITLRIIQKHGPVQVVKDEKGLTYMLILDYPPPSSIVASKGALPR